MSEPGASPEPGAKASLVGEDERASAGRVPLARTSRKTLVQARRVRLTLTGRLRQGPH